MYGKIRWLGSSDHGKYGILYFIGTGMSVEMLCGLYTRSLFVLRLQVWTYIGVDRYSDPQMQTDCFLLSR